jgi:hypothetical protein
MDEKLGIIFLHHEVNQVVMDHLQRIRSLNPEAVVATISAGEPLPGGYTIDWTPQVKLLHSQCPRRGGDLLLCSWFLQRREDCEKWWIVEWDSFCNVSVRDYYRPVWHFPFVASSVRLLNREPEWIWFQEAEKLADIYKPFMTGIVPFHCLLSEAALKETCTTLLENPCTVANSELRFATAANKSGFAPCGYSPPNDQITWMPWQTLPENPTIVHPVKHSANVTAQKSGG